MIAGGDMNKISGDAKKYFCGGALRPNFDPAKDGDAECKAAVDKDLKKAYAEITDPKQRANLERYLQIWYGQPLFECILTTGIFGKSGLNATTGPKGQACMAEYVGDSPDRKINVSGWGLEIPNPPAQLKAFGEYVAWAVSMVKMNVMVPHSVPVPDAVSSLEEFRDDPDVYLTLLRLMGQALDQAGAEKMGDDDLRKAIDAIGRELANWAKDKKPQGNDAVRAYVGDVTPDGKDFIVDVESAPKALFDPEALGLPKGTKLPDSVMSELSRIFYHSLMNSKARGLEDSDPDSVAKAVTGAISEKVKAGKIETPEKLGHLLATIRSVVPQAKAKDADKKALDSVRMDEALAGKVPGRLLIGMNLDPNTNCDVLRALRELWNREIEDDDTYKALSKDEKAAATEKIVDQLLKYLPKPDADAVERANAISKTYVRSMGKDGKMDLDEPPSQLFRRFEKAGAAGIALNRVLTSKFFKNAEADNEKQPAGKKLSRGKLASQVAERADQVDRYKDSVKLPLDLKKHDGEALDFNESNAARAALLERAEYKGIKDGEIEPFGIAKDNLAGLKVDAAAGGGVYSRDGKAAGGISSNFKISYVHGFEDSKFSLGGELSVKAGYTPGMFGDPSDQLMYSPGSDSFGYKLGSASLFVGYKINDDASLKGSAGIIGGLGELNSLFGGKLGVGYEKGGFELNAGAAFGRVLNISSMDVAASGGKQLEMTDLATNLNLGVAYLIHGGSKTRIGMDAMYQPVFGTATLHNAAFTASFNTSPKWGNGHSLPISVSNTVTGFGMGESKSTIFNEFSAELGYRKELTDYVGIGPILGVTHFYGTPEEFDFIGTNPGTQIFENKTLTVSAGLGIYMKSKDGTEFSITPTGYYQPGLTNGEDSGGFGVTIGVKKGIY
ncbi:MAG TPA: hypothetical protein PLZ86_01760 [bacterium]|nr:hypothetical protein [bacterium]